MAKLQTLHSKASIVELQGTDGTECQNDTKFSFPFSFFLAVIKSSEKIKTKQIFQSNLEVSMCKNYCSTMR